MRKSTKHSAPQLPHVQNYTPIVKIFVGQVITLFKLPMNDIWKLRTLVSRTVVVKAFDFH